MKVYYYSQTLEKMAFAHFFNPKARHAAAVIDFPEHGLVKFEIGFEGAAGRGKMKLHITPIDEIHRQTKSTKGRWSYHMGITTLPYDKVVAFVQNWVKEHPDYLFVKDNCRTFANAVLREALKNGTIAPGLNSDAVFEDPCQEAERQIRDKGKFNTETHVISDYTASKSTAKSMSGGGGGGYTAH